MIRILDSQSDDRTRRMIADPEKYFREARTRAREDAERRREQDLAVRRRRAINRAAQAR